MNMNELPKISVIMPSYNQAFFLEAGIQSVLSQNYPNLEFIIMDGGSDDGSAEIIKRYDDRLTYWQSEPDGGQTVAINAGMARATGDILCWLNSDDQFYPNALKTVFDFFVNYPACMWAAGTGDIVTPVGRILDSVIPHRLDFSTLCDWFDNAISQPSVFWRRSLWNEVGGLDESLDFSMDFDLWLSFAQRSEGMVIPETLSQAVIHEDMKTKQCAAESFVETYLVIHKYGEKRFARDKLARLVRRAFEIDQKLSFITKNPLYRKWRNRLENG